MKKSIIVILAVAMMALTLAACASTPTPTPSPTVRPSASPVVTAPPVATVAPSTTPELSPQNTIAPSATNGTGANGESAPAIADKIVTEVDKLSEVKGSTALVVGDTALVGIEFAEQYKGELTTRIKDMVVEKAMAADSNIKRVAVSADPDILTRIKTMVSDIAGGKIGDAGTQFTEIVNRILPQTS